VTGTERAVAPFWSPDGRSIGFFADQRLKVLDLASPAATPRTLANVLEARGATWSPEGVIVYSQSIRHPLYRVDARGGVPTAVTKLDGAAGETTHRYPFLLPDGKRFLYLVRGNPSGKNALWAGSLDRKLRQRVVDADSNAAFVPPHWLIFGRGTKLLAAPFDPDRLAITGESVEIADRIQRSPATAFSVFSASETGLLAFATSESGPISRLVWFDRQGHPTPTAFEGDYYSAALSPSGDRLCVSYRNDESAQPPNLWLLDPGRGVTTRLTTDLWGVNLMPNWSPDGRRIAFESTLRLARDIHIMAVDGGPDEVALESGQDKFVTGWCPDGSCLLYQEIQPDTRGDIWVLPLSGDRKPRPFLVTPFDEGSARFSPDGKWIAYHSDESGRPEIYVATFPGNQKRQRLSAEGGSSPRWRRDGREIFYASLADEFVAVTLEPRRDELSPGNPQVLFRAPVRRSSVAASAGAWDVTADGQRFIVAVRPEGTAPPVTLMFDWMAELKR
jgi:Tol biopolymer transport system component